MNRIVVVGASAAGLGTVEALRKLGFAGEIEVIGAEMHMPYDRPPLSKQLLVGQMEPCALQLAKPSTIESLNAGWNLGVAAVDVDVTASTVSLSDGSRMTWDALVIATGVRPKALPLGAGLRGVLTLRTVDDALALQSAIKKGSRLVVVGGGFIGTEVAATARALGAEVTIVDPLDNLVAHRLESRMSALLTQLHTSHGIHLRLGVTVKEVVGDGRSVKSVRLSDDTEIPADIVLVSIGSTANVEWLAGSGLATSDGVECDSTGRAAPMVYAAGDVAKWEYPSLGRTIRIEHRMTAIDHGRRIAKELATQFGVTRTVAEDVPLPIPYFWTDQFDNRLQAYGLVSPDARIEIIAGEYSVTGRFAAAYFDRSDRMIAGLAWNYPKFARVLRDQVAQQQYTSSRA